MVTPAEIGLWILTALWIVYIIRTRPKRMMSQKIEVVNKELPSIETQPVRDPRDDGFDPMRKTGDQLRRDVLAHARKKQKEGNQQ